MVRIPQIAGIETAIRIYYENVEIKNADIRELFGANIGGAKLVKLKMLAKEVMTERNIPSLDATAVNTALLASSLDIANLLRKILNLAK